MNNNKATRKSNLIKNTFIIFLGTLFTRLVSFFLLPLYTGILSTSEYGVIDLLNTLISLIVPIITLQIDQALFRFLISERNNKTNIKKIVSNSFFFLLISLSFYLLLFIFISVFIQNEYKYLLALILIANVFSNFCLQFSRGVGNNKTYSIAGFMIAISTIISNIIFLLGLKYRVTGMLIGSLIGNLIGSSYLFIRLKIYTYLSITLVNKQYLKKMLKYSVPLVPNQLSWWVFNTSDRVIVTILLGLSYTGLLSIAYKFSSIYILLYNIFNTSWTESVSLHIDDDDFEEFFNSTFNEVFNLFYSIALCMISFLTVFFSIFINSKFSESYYLIPIAIFAGLFQVIVGLVSTVYVAKSDTKAIANTSIVSAIVNLVIHFSLIKYIGIYAAVVSTLLSYLIFAIYRTFDVNKKYVKINVKLLFFISKIPVLLFALIVYYLSNNIYINITSLLIISFYTIVLNRKSIINLKNLVYEKIRRK